VIVKFFKHGKGSGKGPVDYLLGKNRDREHAKVLSGDPELTSDLISSLKFASKYTSGVLSFVEKDVLVEEKQDIMRRFEEAMFPDMKGEYDILWVEHTDKGREETPESGRLELNFVIPKVHLPTGQSLNVYSHKADMTLMRAFKRDINASYLLSDPEEPIRRRSITKVSNSPKTASKLREELHREIKHCVEDGIITNRDEMLETLKAVGHEIVRTTSRSITIKNPDPKSKKNIRLTGEFYGELFRFNQEAVIAQEGAQGIYGERCNKHVRTLKKDLRRRIRWRSERQGQRYKTNKVDNDYRLTLNSQFPDSDLNIAVSRKREQQLTLSESTEFQNSSDTTFPERGMGGVQRNIRTQRETSLPGRGIENDNRYRKANAGSFEWALRNVRAKIRRFVSTLERVKPSHQLDRREIELTEAQDARNKLSYGRYVSVMQTCDDYREPEIGRQDVVPDEPREVSPGPSPGM